MTNIDTQTAQQVANSTNKVYGPNSMAADRDTFLKLLIAQLKNQDPLDPIKDQEFVAQLAQFSSLEKLSSIEAQLAEGTASNVVSQAMSLVGKTVALDDPETGTEVSGKVESVTLLGDNALTVRIGEKNYPISYIKSVGEAKPSA